VELGIKLPADFDVSTIKKGNVLCDSRYPMKLIRSFIARIIIYDIPSPIAKGEAVVIHSHTTKAPGKIAFLLATIDQSTGETIKDRPKFLRKGQFANVQIKLEERMCLELFKNFKNLGRIAIRRENHTIAAGTIIEFVS
jgi:elongation factor 1 alpha-like protein